MTVTPWIFTVLLSLTGLLCLFVAGMVWRRRFTSTSAVPLVVLLIALTWWNLTYAIFFTGLPGPTPYFWLDITYVGVVTVPPSLLMFAAAFTNRNTWFRQKIFLALAIEPVLVLVTMFTDPWHNLFFGGKRMLSTAMILEAGPVFWINVIYSYLLILVATIWLIQAYLKATGIFRKQLGTVLLGIGITWINSIVLILGLNPPNISAVI